MELGVHVQNLATGSNFTTLRSLSARDEEYRGLQLVQMHMVQTYSPRAKVLSNHFGPRISKPSQVKVMS